MENREYDDVIGQTGTAPFTNELASRYGLATQYHARTHPSLPNYIDLIAGTTKGITTDCEDCNVEGQTIADQLAQRGIGWTAYMGGMPNPCFRGTEYPEGTSSGYAKKHDPFMYFGQLRDNDLACRNIVPLDGLAGDLASGAAAPFLWISPNLCDDGHKPSCGLGAADAWLKGTIPAVTASSWYQAGGVIIVTWDEGSSDASCCNGGARGGHVATIVISAATTPGQRLDAPVDHVGTLRTIERIYGVDNLASAADPVNGDLLPLVGRSP